MNSTTTTTGQIFNIQRFSTHDGPGIRTTVFLKGCPLRCFWCQNPESQSMKPVLMYTQKLCTGCGRCIEHCPNGAITGDGRFVQVDREKCTGSGECVRVCTQKARKLAGEMITVEALMKELVKDAKIYQNSGGGVTISGGDPIFQHDFTLAVLRACHEELIDTAIETSGFASWEILEPIVDESDYIFMDLKCMDSAKHKAGTGVPNEQILENAKKIVAKGCDVHFRMPLIPGFNDDGKSVEALRRFVVDELNLEPLEHVELLKYNKLGEDKFGQIDRSEEVLHYEPQSEERFMELKKILYGKDFNEIL